MRRDKAGEFQSWIYWLIQFCAHAVLRLGLKMADGCGWMDRHDECTPELANGCVVGCRTEWQMTGHLAMPWLRRLVAGLSPRSPGFDPMSAHVQCMMCKVALGQVPFLSRRFSPLALSFHHCSKLIHLSSMLYNLSNWQRLLINSGIHK